jgi:hypothetical protein
MALAQEIRQKRDEATRQALRERAKSLEHGSVPGDELAENIGKLRGKDEDEPSFPTLRGPASWNL